MAADEKKKKRKKERNRQQTETMNTTLGHKKTIWELADRQPPRLAGIFNSASASPPAVSLPTTIWLGSSKTKYNT